MLILLAASGKALNQRYFLVHDSVPVFRLCLLSAGCYRPDMINFEPLDKDWQTALAGEFASDYFAELKAFLAAEIAAGKQIYPAPEDYLRALILTPLAGTRVVILGQDPYHGPGQAHGLCFSVKPGVRPPPSLVNIYKELHTDLGLSRPNHGFLEPWARQGVLLLNNILTVEAGSAGSHRSKGWERFTDAIIAQVAAKDDPVIFLLWGSHAMEKAAKVQTIADNGRHLILTAPHPSPLSAYRGFFGCKHFSQANIFLQQHGFAAIDWQV